MGLYSGCEGIHVVCCISDRTAMPLFVGGLLLTTHDKLSYVAVRCWVGVAMFGVLEGLRVLRMSWLCCQRRSGTLDQGLGALRFLNGIIEKGNRQQLLSK